MEVFAAPFPSRIPARTCAGETLWDTKTPDPTPAQMSPYCKTLLSGYNTVIASTLLTGIVDLKSMKVMLIDMSVNDSDQDHEVL